MKSSVRLLLAAAIAALAMSAYALEPTGSASFRVNYSTANGASAVVASASFKVLGNTVSMANTRVQSSQPLPVTLTSFTID